MVGVLAGEDDVVGVCAGRGRKEEKMESQLSSLGAGPIMGELCGCDEKTCGGGEAMWAASVMALDARNSSGEVGAVLRAALMLARK